MARPDKQQVIDEVWDAARIASFLEKAPLGADEDPDYSALLYAYRSMRPDDFADFVERFVAAGRDLNARGRQGETLLETIAAHRHGAPFRDIVRARLTD
jgi:ankyrin repeat protein